MNYPFWNQEKADQLIPEHMHDDLKLYLETGVIFDNFLLAVLQNNLKEAVYQADSVNIVRLHDYVKYLFNYAPQGSWGSPDNVASWYHQCKMLKDQP